MTKYILGAGISGLIFGFYNPSYTIISDNLGGKLSNSFMKNTILLHSTPETKQLLLDLGFEVKEKTHIIKYYKDDSITQDISVSDKIQFIKKKLNDSSIEIKDITLSTNDYYISILDVDLSKVIEKLKEKNTIIEDKIIRITNDEIITERTKYKYSDIVSTINGKVFESLCYNTNSLSLKNKSITLVLCDKLPIELEGINFDLCYFIDDKYKFTRINKRGTEYLYEFSECISEEDVKKYLPVDSNVLQYHVDNNGIIITNKNNIPPRNIKFLGRFAQWDHTIKIQDVIKFSQWNYDFRNIWNRQAKFTSQVIDFNVLTNIESKENETHLLLLHIFDEISEVLNETNYKKHKVRHSVNVDNVKEEIIDIFKYLINLSLVWGIDVKEFVELFNNKSDIVEKRFEEDMQ